MKKTWLIYGIFMGALIFCLKMSEYWIWLKFNAFDYYIIIVSVIFLIAGLWLGIKYNTKSSGKIIHTIEPKTTQSDIPATSIIKESHSSKALVEKLNLSKRELEVLKLLGKGMTNQEIADSLFVSQNTVKSHTGRLFEKLDAKNRTQAILIAQEAGLL